MALPPMPMPGASGPAGGAPLAAPSPNPGHEAAAMAKVQAAVRVLLEASSGLDPASDGGQTVLQCIQRLSKVAGTAPASPGVGVEALRGLAQQAGQQAPLLALLRQQQGGGGQPPPGGGAPPPATG